MEELGREYEHAHGYVFDRRDKPTDENDQKVRGGDRSDPTYAIALGHIGGRELLRRQSAKLRQGVPGGKTVAGILEKLQGLYATPEEEYEPLESYRTLSQDETDEWKSAQRKRELRDTNAEIARLENRIRILKGKARRLA